MNKIQAPILLLVLLLFQACCNCNDRDTEPMFTPEDLAILPSNKSHADYYLIHSGDSILVHSTYMEDQVYNRCGGIGFTKCFCPEDRTKYAYYKAGMGDTCRQYLNIDLKKSKTGLTTDIDLSGSSLSVKETHDTYQIGCNSYKNIKVYLPTSTSIYKINNDANIQLKEVWYSTVSGIVRMVDQNGNNWDIPPSCL